MNISTDREKMLSEMTRAEKAELLQWIVRDLGEDLLARATQIGRTLLTINRLDFKRLHRQMPEHAGIIICTEDPDRVGQAQRVASIAEAGALRGRLLRVYRPARKD